MDDICAVGLKQKLVSLDRAVIGRSYGVRDTETPHWVKGLAGAYPIVTGSVAAAAFSQSRGAGVGVLIGLVLAIPLAFLARLTAKR